VRLTYFKLDANFWGAMHGGHLHDPKATRIEAYRRSMEAIRQATGDAFILGCNQPMWPSLGLVHGSRSSGDIKRSWATFHSHAQEALSRNWQNGRLWWNDPEAVLFSCTLTKVEYRFHATSAFASGGMILSGDDLTNIPPDRLAMLASCCHPPKPRRSSTILQRSRSAGRNYPQASSSAFQSYQQPEDHRGPPTPPRSHSSALERRRHGQARRHHHPYGHAAPLGRNPARYLNPWRYEAR
jgi:hypothetical protein